MLKLAGIRLYRCETCQRQHHGTKWLKTLAPLPQTPGRRSGGGLARWKRRYAAWRLREGRHAHKALMFAVALLAAVSGFFLFLLNSDRWLAG